jgi:hypothetical protein
MKFIKGCMLLSLLGVTHAAAQPQDIFINRGFLDPKVAMPINAVTFVNEGLITLGGPLEFDTQNTLFFTNSGVMTHDSGFVFEHIDDDGRRSPAASFVNHANATIGADTPAFTILIDETNVVTSPRNRISINATNIVNTGLISVGSSGLLSIKGEHVDLSDSGLMVAPISGMGNLSTGTNFAPDQGIFDNYWGGLTNQIMDSSGLLNVVGTSANVISPAHMVTNDFPMMATLALQGADAFIISNAITETNIIVQAVFSSVGDPRISTQVRFEPSAITNNVSTAMVEYSVPLTNVVTGTEDLFTLYLADTLAWSTNLVMESNLAQDTYKPSTYGVSRTPPMSMDYDWFNGLPGNGELTPDLLYNTTFSNTTVTNYYAAYSALVENTADTSYVSPDIPVQESQGGRIDITADVLDLSNTRIRGEGLISLNAKHFINGSSAAIDARNLNFGLASTNQVLNLAGVSKPQVDRFTGAIHAYSAIWTNLSGIVIEEPGEGEDAEPTMITNTVEYLYHVLLIDATELQTTADVFTHDLAVEAPSVRIGDNMNVLQSLSINAADISFDSQLNFFHKIDSLGTENWPETRNMTVNGSLAVSETAVFGADTDEGLDSFTNHGSVSAFNQRYKSDYFENTGIISGGGRIEVNAKTGKLESGTITAGLDLLLQGNNIKMRSHELDTSGRLYLDVTETLTDSGAEANNMIRVNNGFHMLSMPQQGDLLGTTIESVIPRFGNVAHVWGGRNLGRSSAGYKDNAALGTLILTGPGGSRAQFGGGGTESALYVDHLQLNDSFISSWRQTIKIAPNFTLYVGSSNVAVEELEAAFGGRIQWVSNYAGPISGVPVVQPDGTTIFVNRARKESTLLDDDGDGIANGLDVTPFDGVTLTEINVSANEQQTASIGFTAAGSTTYRVEFKENLFDQNWNYLESVTNSSRQRKHISIEDQVGSRVSGRFYRVTYTP